MPVPKCPIAAASTGHLLLPFPGESAQRSQCPPALPAHSPDPTLLALATRSVCLGLALPQGRGPELNPKACLLGYLQKELHSGWLPWLLLKFVCLF